MLPSVTLASSGCVVTLTCWSMFAIVAHPPEKRVGRPMRRMRKRVDRMFLSLPCEVASLNLSTYEILFCHEFARILQHDQEGEELSMRIVTVVYRSGCKGLRVGSATPILLIASNNGSAWRSHVTVSHRALQARPTIKSQL